MAFGAAGSGPGEFSFPAGIASHPDGRVAVVDSLKSPRSGFSAHRCRLRRQGQPMIQVAAIGFEVRELGHSPFQRPSSCWTAPLRAQENSVGVHAPQPLDLGSR